MCEPYLQHTFDCDTRLDLLTDHTRSGLSSHWKASDGWRANECLRGIHKWNSYRQRPDQEVIVRIIWSGNVGTMSEMLCGRYDGPEANEINDCLGLIEGQSQIEGHDWLGCMYMCTCTCNYTYVCAYVFVFVYMFLWMYVYYIYASMHTCMYWVYIYLCLYIYIYIHMCFLCMHSHYLYERLTVCSLRMTMYISTQHKSKHLPLHK